MRNIDLTDTGHLLGMSHIFRNLSVLAAHGIGMGVALGTIARQSPMHNGPLELCRKTTIEKGSLSKGLWDAGINPSFIPHVISVAEGVGKLEHGLLTISSFFDALILDHSRSHTAYDPKFGTIFDLYMLALLYDSCVQPVQLRHKILIQNCSMANRTRFEHILRFVVDEQQPLSRAFEHSEFRFMTRDWSCASHLWDAEQEGEAHVALKQIVNGHTMLFNKQFIPFPEVPSVVVQPA